MHCRRCQLPVVGVLQRKHPSCTHSNAFQRQFFWAPERGLMQCCRVTTWLPPGAGGRIRGWLSQPSANSAISRQLSAS